MVKTCLERKIRQEAKSFDELVGMMEDIDEKYIGDEEFVPTNKIDAYVKESDEFGNKQWVSVDDVLKILKEEKQKLEELADLLKNLKEKWFDPEHYSDEAIRQEIEDLEKKFVVLFDVEFTKGGDNNDG